MRINEIGGKISLPEENGGKKAQKTEIKRIKLKFQVRQKNFMS